AVRKLWFAPLEKHLKADGKLPAVRRLFVVPSGHIARLPMEVVAPEYTNSYTPSATLLVRALASRRALKAEITLALGDPAFNAPAPAAPPKHGILVAAVPPGGPAHKAGLRAADVLLRYDGKNVEGVSDLVAALKKNAKGKAVFWRDGKELT